MIQRGLTNLPSQFTPRFFKSNLHTRTLTPPAPPLQAPPPIPCVISFDSQPAIPTLPSVNTNPEKTPKERETSLCPCKSRLSYATCCMPYHYGQAAPETAEQLMRSRYSAYFFRRIDYLVDTTHPDTREPDLKNQLENTIHEANWSFLTIVGTAKGGKSDKVGKVEFVADYFLDGQAHELHERSRFKRFKGAWKYLDGKG